jgi:hypothetical protein
MHRDFSRPPTIAVQVTTLPDVAGDAPSHTYRFLLDLPIVDPPYFTELHTNTLPTSWSSWRPGPDHDPAGCFHADPDEKLLTLELGFPNSGVPMASFVQHTLHVPHTAFLSHIAAHRAACACAPDTVVGGPVVVVPWSVWSPGRTHLTTVPDMFVRERRQHRVCGMHALDEPHLLLDRGILRITDYHPHRVARARAAAATVPVGSGDDDPAAAAVEAGGGGGGEEVPRGGPDCDHDHDTARGEPPRGGGVQIPHVEKDIPLPDGLRFEYVPFRCILGEDVVVLLEVGHHFRRRSVTQHGTRLVPPDPPMHLVRGPRIEKIYHHPI